MQKQMLGKLKIWMAIW